MVMGKHCCLPQSVVMSVQSDPPVAVLMLGRPISCLPDPLINKRCCLLLSQNCCCVLLGVDRQVLFLAAVSCAACLETFCNVSVGTVGVDARLVCCQIL